MYKLVGRLQHYAWGGYEFIPHLLGIENTDHRPCAEYWMGAHPAAPSKIEINNNTLFNLDKMVKQDPINVLGEEVFRHFGELPYLLKVLDVKEMLSIQVHPGKEEAAKGFEHENSLGIPLDAPYRNYKDRNYKPEVMLALSEFWLLHGFRPKNELKRILEEVESFSSLIPIFEKESYRGLYTHVMEMPAETASKILKPLISQIREEFLAGRLTKSDPSYWAAMASAKGNHSNPDRGIFSIYFFNLLNLHPGQAIFQGAGLPHAYLEGQNIELMSNSDNVLRGGLTTKHVDVAELLKQIRFEATDPAVMNGSRYSMETTYSCPVPDFILSRIELKVQDEYQHHANSPEILFLTQGSVQLSGKGAPLNCHKGEAIFVSAGEDYTIQAIEEADIFKAAVPG